MFVANKLIYLELQKTGGTHLRRMLECYTKGHVEGKHNRMPPEYANRYIVGSIRNPWDWYVSLWAYGASGQGAIRSRAERRIDIGYYNRLLPKAMGKNWLTPREWVVSIYHDAIKPVPRWQYAYGNSSDAELFREWIRLLLDSKRRFDIGEGYGFSPLSMRSGLLSYRYFRLFTLGGRIFRDRRLQNNEGIADFDREFNIIRDIIKTESLEEDFIRVMREAGYSFSADQLAEIRNPQAGKTNVSERKPAKFYYDDETIELVAERDKYIIEKYQYQPPL